MASSDLNKREQKTPGVGEKKNTPHSKTAIIIGLLIVGGLIAAAFLSPEGSKDPREEKEKQIQVSEGSRLRPSDPIKLALTNPTIAETVAPTPPPTIKLPEPPKPPEMVIKEISGDRGPAVQQGVKVRRRVKVTQNQALAKWLQLQAQTFQAPPKLEMKDDQKKNSVAENGSDELDQKMAELLKNGQALIDSYAGGGPQKSQKELFFENAGKNNDNMVLKATRQSKVAPYTLPAGTVIPCELITGINTDLPGNITAAVTEHVYDFVNPQLILIPQGSKLFGMYNSNVDFGQKRVQFVLKRLTYPDGSTLDLNGMPATDPQGFTGVRDQANMHYGPMLMAGIFTAAFGALPDLLIDNKNTGGSYNSREDKYETAQSKIAESIGDMGKSFFSKQLNRQPTLVVRPGKKFMIQANVDIPFTRVWRAKARRW